MLARTRRRRCSSRLWLDLTRLKACLCSAGGRATSKTADEMSLIVSLSRSRFEDCGLILAHGSDLLRCERNVTSIIHSILRTPATSEAFNIKHQTCRFADLQQVTALIDKMQIEITCKEPERWSGREIIRYQACSIPTMLLGG